ncbi:MAG: zinc-dependent metalloprotease [Pseudomonadota bacterium]
MAEFQTFGRAGYWRALTVGLAAGGLIFSGSAQAQDDDDKKDDKKKGPPTIEKKTEDFEKSEGLFEIYTDPKNGDIYIEIDADQLEQEFVAFSYTENGVLEAGHFRGAYRDQRVISVDRHFDRLEFIEESTAFYFDESQAIARASEANISPAILAATKIAAITPATEGEDATPERYLVKANKLFLTEALHKVTPFPNPDADPRAFKVGGIASDRTKFDEIRNYPQNTDFIVDYVFENKNPLNGGSAAVTDARSVTVKVQHSLIAMPDDAFEPRIDDYRVGYFFDQVTDLTTDAAAPYRDLINRWRLVKQDPEAAVSDPVEPITWWIENTTPREYRQTIRDAVLAWNSSFEKAGFSNAVVVEEQPDDADWDAGDIRYNVLRWTSSPIPPFGGYGPSFTNPRTGEIIGADIMLEYSFITNRSIFADVFEGAALPSTEAHAHDVTSHRNHLCTFSEHLKAANSFGLAALQATGASDEDIEALIKESIYYLMLHEVGHTLGLNHNMKASTLYGPREVHDASVTQGAPTGSVMDYPAVNIAPPGVAQGDYYMTRPGPYDDWAIEFGYRADLDGAAREALLARSTEPGNIFGNDADDMRSPGSGIDPRVMINDMSTDPVAYGVDRIMLVKETLPKLLEKFDDENSWQTLVRAYFFATGQHAVMANVMSRQVGGVYVDRTKPGQDGGLDAPYTPVPLERQKAAMDALSEHVFAADAFDAPEDLLRHLQSQRRGFNFFGATEDPKIHARALGIQMGVLDHLLHPNVMLRMTDTELYGNRYSAADMISNLNDAIFGGDLRGSPNAFRRNLQTAYLQRLVAIVDDPSYDPTARAAALAGAENVRSRLGLLEFGLSAETRAHRLQIKRILRRV